MSEKIKFTRLAIVDIEYVQTLIKKKYWGNNKKDFLNMIKKESIIKGLVSNNLLISYDEYFNNRKNINFNNIVRWCYINLNYCSEEQKNIFIKSLKVWNFKSALLIKQTFENQEKVVFNSGWTPSGEVHIGTIREIVLTDYVKWSFEKLFPLRKTVLYSTVDDSDPLLKITPFLNKLQINDKHLGCLVRKIKTNKGTSLSFFLQKKTKEILDRINVSLYMISNYDLYQSGKYTPDIQKLFSQQEDVIKILQKPQEYQFFHKIKDNFIDKEKTHFTEAEVASNFIKLGWRTEWAVKWKILNVNYEMCGKDIFDTSKSAKKIYSLVSKKTPPIIEKYEFIMNEGDQKISKSQGNFISWEIVNQLFPWWTMKYFCCMRPTSSRIWSLGNLFGTTNIIIKEIINYENIWSLDRLSSPLLYVFNDKVPIIEEKNLSFTTLIKRILNFVPINNSQMEKERCYNSYLSTFSIENNDFFYQLFEKAFIFCLWLQDNQVEYRVLSSIEIKILKIIRNKLNTNTTNQKIISEMKKASINYGIIYPSVFHCSSGESFVSLMDKIPRSHIYEKLDYTINCRFIKTIYWSFSSS